MTVWHMFKKKTQTYHIIFFFRIFSHSFFILFIRRVLRRPLLVQNPSHSHAGKTPAESLQTLFMFFDVKNNFWKRQSLKKMQHYYHNNNCQAWMQVLLQAHPSVPAKLSWVEGEDGRSSSLSACFSSFRSVADTCVTWAQFLFTKLELRQVKINMKQRLG